MIRVASGWSPRGKILYGEKFLASFDKHWSIEIELQVYVEEPHPMPRNACRSLWDIPGAREMAVKTDTPRHHGRDPSFGRWKDSERRKGYSFRQDAGKFWKQCLIPQQAAIGMDDGDILLWLDGDVITTRQVTPSMIERLIGGHDIFYLGRERSHAEIGVWGVRINTKTRAFLADVAAIYTTGEFESLPETHSSFCWGIAKARAGLNERNLTPGGRGHVFPKSPVSGFLIHNKGPRKGTER